LQETSDLRLTSKGERARLPEDQESVSVSQHIDKGLRQRPKPLVPGKITVHLVKRMRNIRQIQLITALRGGEKEQEKTVITVQYF
jgi:hypothetical protein